MKLSYILVIVGFLTSMSHAVEFLSSDYVAALGQRYPSYKNRIDSITTELNTIWTQYKSTEQEVADFEGESRDEARALKVRVESLATNVNSKTKELGNMLCEAACEVQRKELKEQVTEEAEWFIIKN